MTFPIEDPPHRYNASKMYRSGKTTKEVAKHYHVRRTRVEALLREMKVPLHKGGQKPKFDRVEAKRLYVEEMWSISRLAKHYNVAKISIWTALHKLNAPMRPAGVSYGKSKPQHFPVIRTLLARGLSREHIATCTGQSRYVVQYVETFLGAPPRSSPLYRTWVERLSREAA